MEKTTKSITIIQSDFILKNIQDEEPEIRSYTSHFTEFDREGRPLKDARYMKNGEPEEIVEYSYDETGRLVSERYFQEEDFFTEEITYYYSDKPYADSASKKYADGSVDTITFEYDADGLLLSKTFTNEDGETEQKDICIYESGRLVRVESYDSEENLMSVPFQDETLSGQTRITKNDAGQVILEEELDAGGEVIMTVNRSYSENGLPLETEVFIDGQGKSISRHYILNYEYTFFD